MHFHNGERRNWGRSERAGRGCPPASLFSFPTFSPRSSCTPVWRPASPPPPHVRASSPSPRHRYCAGLCLGRGEQLFHALPTAVIDIRDPSRTGGTPTRTVRYGVSGTPRRTAGLGTDGRIKQQAAEQGNNSRWQIFFFCVIHKNGMFENKSDSRAFRPSCHVPHTRTGNGALVLQGPVLC